MRRLRNAVFITFVIAFSAGSQEQSADTLYRTVVRMSGLGPEARRAFVRAELGSMGVPFERLPFDTTVTRRSGIVQITGENITVTFGSGGRTVIVGAHLDAVPGSPGANDNAGGVSVVLGLIRDLKAHRFASRVVFVFFDQEEVGLIGSAVYVRERVRKEEFAAMLNLDVVGIGETIYAGPAGGGDDDIILPLLRDAAIEIGAAHVVSEHYPPSDHLSFARAGLENISLSVVPADDVPRLVGLLSSRGSYDGATPSVLTTMHTPGDSAATVGPSSLLLAYRTARALVLKLDAAAR